MRSARSFAVDTLIVLVRLFSVLFAVLLISACSAPPTGEAAALPGTSWTVERIVLEDGGLERGDGSQQITFGDDGSVAVSSCNDCSGRYTIEDDALSFVDVLACTKRACPTGVLELDRLLEGETQISRDGDFLVLQPAASETRILLSRSVVES